MKFKQMAKLNLKIIEKLFAVTLPNSSRSSGRNNNNNNNTNSKGNNGQTITIMQLK